MIKYLLIGYYGRDPRVSKDGKKYYKVSHRSFQKLLEKHRWGVIYSEPNTGTYLQKC